MCKCLEIQWKLSFWELFKLWQKDAQEGTCSRWNGAGNDNNKIDRVEVVHGRGRRGDHSPHISGTSS